MANIQTNRLKAQSQDLKYPQVEIEIPASNGQGTTKVKPKTFVLKTVVKSLFLISSNG